MVHIGFYTRVNNMKCKKCSKDMVISPFLLTSMPPQSRYDCKCGNVEFIRHGILSDYTKDDYNQMLTCKVINPTTH